MAKIAYITRKFKDHSLDVIEKANEILESYAAEGYDLTLRQLYYQFVSRALIPNNQREYDNLGGIINDGRLAGLIDWDHIVDRTRNIRGNSHWTSPAEILEQCARQFEIDKWAGQPWRVECWIEKDALIGVVERVCRKLDISYFSCRGYVSQSEIHEAAKDRLIPFERAGQRTLILHLGDHDPSGIDMSRDIQDRLAVFGCAAEVCRIALNMDQVEQYNPPPNPAKLSDCRAIKYIAKFGESSWELDALEPSVIGSLITHNVAQVRDDNLWAAAQEKQKTMKNQLRVCSDYWGSDVVPLLNDLAPTHDDEEDS
jgi:hypothetical protein